MKGPAAIKLFLQKYPLFLLTIPFVFFVHMANYYFRLLHWKYIATEILLYLTIPFVIYFLAGRLWRSYAKAAIATGVSLIIFYFFHLFYDWVKNVPVLSVLSKYSVVLPLLIAGMIALLIYLHRKKSSFRTFFYFINLVFLLLLTGGLVQLAYQYLTGADKRYDQADPAKTLSANYSPCDTCSNPDIYFILLDGYTNSKTLQREFGYDNHFIENNLREKGFFIAANSKSNYNFTHMSLGSELNLSYLSRIDNDHRFYTIDFLKAYRTVYDNELCAILKKQGYEINNYSIFDIRGAQSRITPFLTELTWRSVPGQTFFNKVRRDIGWHLLRFYPKDHIPAAKKEKMRNDLQRIKETYEGVIRVSRQEHDKPQFTYAHFLLPHETFYFDSSGNRLDRLYTSQTMLNKKDYLNQLVYINKFLLAPLTDSIFRHARRPFVMIIQGDHGYRAYPKEKVQLEFENFCALYFPGQRYEARYDSLSSVNTFRVVLNNFFGQQLSLLSDSTINLYKKNSY